ncbi:hypothetical protein F2P56_022290, partial [Juglans regia]
MEDRGEGEQGGGDEEEAMGSEEGGRSGGREREGGTREAKPDIGKRIVGEGLMVLGGGVVEAVKKKPGAAMGLGGGRGEGGGGDDGVPDLADGGGSDEGRDWEEGEDVLRQVRAKRAKSCH